MTEHLANGQFARKEVGQPVKNGRKRDTRFKKGNPGRPKGSLNKTTRAVKEFLAELCNKVSVQEAVEARIQKGDAVAFFRALEHVVGKPAETVDANVKHSGGIDFRWLSDK